MQYAATCRQGHSEPQHTRESLASDLASKATNDGNSSQNDGNVFGTVSLTCRAVGSIGIAHPQRPLQPNFVRGQ